MEISTQAKKRHFCGVDFLQWSKCTFRTSLNPFLRALPGSTFSRDRLCVALPRSCGSDFSLAATRKYVARTEENNESFLLLSSAWQNGNEFRSCHKFQVHAFLYPRRKPLFFKRRKGKISNHSYSILSAKKSDQKRTGESFCFSFVPRKKNNVLFYRA